MKIQETIQKAENGGLEISDSFKKEFPLSIQIKLLCLEPGFFQALGKSLNWDGQLWCGRSGCGNGGEHFHPNSGEAWLPKWYALITHLAEGGDIESYFKEIKTL